MTRFLYQLISWWHGHFPRWLCQDSMWIWIVHQSPDLNSTENLWDVLDMWLCGLVTRSNHHKMLVKVIQHWMEIQLLTMLKLTDTITHLLWSKRKGVLCTGQGFTMYQNCIDIFDRYQFVQSQIRAIFFIILTQQLTIQLNDIKTHQINY